MNDDNDWDKVNIAFEEEAAILDDVNSPKSELERQLMKAANSEIASLTTVSLMGDDGTDGDTIASSGVVGESAHPLQIVSVGNESNQYAFTFNEKHLNSVLSKVPPKMKVCVVSVVGAFRTGKSFLLSWFLRYLHYCKTNPHSPFLGDGSDEKNKDNSEWFETLESLGNDGFSWRGGAERDTTGIWMWSQPFILPWKTNTETGATENIAVMLVDSQGMFDHETTVGLTAAIFGLSTLLSSYQIYNVDKRIQEDNLQQLALFSEYGRLALQLQKSPKKNDKSKEEDKEGADDTPDTSSESGKDETTIETKPFQKMEFLVRDWQNFDDDEDLDACEKEMKTYLENVLAEREASDLKETRDQISSCYEDVSCYQMTHPGFAVTKKKYSGDVNVIEPTFLSFLNRYCRRVFGNLVAKSIHGRELTAPELGVYIKHYAKMFESRAHFPKAATMLQATANANNTNATNLGIEKYKSHMDSLAGVKCSDYIPPAQFKRDHEDLTMRCKVLFNNSATFGSQNAIKEAREKMNQLIEEHFEMYHKLNESRNPLAGFETYIIPLTIGFFSIILRWVADTTCSSWSQTCKASSDVLSHVYQVVFFFMLIVSSTKAKQIGKAAGRMKKAWEVVGGKDDTRGNQ